MNGKRLACVDLFAGAGGFSLAAANAGLSIIAAVEKNSNACSTYRRNILEALGNAGELYEGDILEISPETLMEAHFAENNGCDVVLGGPPCQGFSVHRINDAGVGDPRNALILRYFEYVATLRPKVFLMENVPGILWPRHKDFLDAFYEQGEISGYDVQPPIVLDARDFGIPQRRKRVFILGVRKDFPFLATWPPVATHGDSKARDMNPALQPWIPASTVFAQPQPDNDENHLHMNHTQELVEVFKSTPLNGGSRRESNRVLPCHDGHSGHADVYGRINPAEPGPTMTTACVNPSKGRFVHPTEHHGITVRQAARFQTFPDWFVFQGGLMAAGEQIGNAVPVQLGEILLRAVVKGIEKGQQEIESRIDNGEAHG
ncbi:MAG: DNA cytosine methyltransferase [Sulfuricella sp.]|nr:DNA cytosine methyltransferase [Sulfuricella sp.]